MSVSEGANVLQLYAQYVEPLEAEHSDKFVAISPDGRTMIGNNTKELRQQADSEFGEGSVIIKIGKLVSPGFRWLRAVPNPPGTPVHPEEDSACQLSIEEAAEQRAKLYALHGKPLEQDHLWKYVAIQPDGKTIVEDDYDVLAAQAKVELGKGSYIFRLGGNNSGTSVKPMELVLVSYD